MRCMPMVAVAAAAFALSATPASAAQVYAGQPSGASPFQFVLTLSSSGKAVTGLTFHFDVACGDFRTVDNGSTLIVDDVPESVQFGRHYLVGAKVKGGKLSGDFMGVDRVDETVVESMKAKLTGKLKPGSATGRVAVAFERFDLATGVTTARCSKTVSWKALRKPGVVFAGKTSQNEPVVVELTADRKRVSHAHIGWWADCADGGGWTDGHDEFDLVPFRLTATGAFSKVFTFGYGDGTSLVERFAGKIGRTSAAGTLQVDVTAEGEAGPTTCTSGTVSWKAATG